MLPKKHKRARAVLRDVITVREAAALGYSVRQVQMLCDCGSIDARKSEVTGQWLIYKPSLLAYMMGVRAS